MSGRATPTVGADFGFEATLLAGNGWVPNNPRLPVLYYRGVLRTSDRKDLASQLEALFAEHGWSPQWRDGIYPYHHYHSTAHEVLGFAAGTAKVMLGGPGGVEVVAKPREVLVLPAGTGHCLLEGSGDLLVIGAYPSYQDWDICRSAPTAAMVARMAALPVPARDPVAGVSGPLTKEWRQPRSGAD